MDDPRRSHTQDQNLQGQAHSPIVSQSIASRAKDECINWTPSLNHLWFYPISKVGILLLNPPEIKAAMVALPSIFDEWCRDVACNSKRET